MRVLGRLFLAILFAAIIIVSLVSADYANVTPDSTPFITIDPIGNHTVGDVFFINGTTNLPASENFSIEVGSIHVPFRPTKTQSKNPIWTWGIFGYLHVISGINKTNTWSFNATDGNWVPDEYLVQVDSYNTTTRADTAAFQNITIFPVNIEISSTVLQTMIQSPSPFQPTTGQTIVPITTQSSHLPVTLPIVVLVIMVVLRFALKKR